MFEDLPSYLTSAGQLPTVKIRLQPSRPSNPRLPEGAAADYLPDISDDMRRIANHAIAAVDPAVQLHPGEASA